MPESRDLRRANFQELGFGMYLGRQTYDSPLPGDERWGFPPGEYEGAAMHRLPRSCPVIPLGYRGESLFFFDSCSQFREIRTRDFSKKTMMDLFKAHENWPEQHFPRWGKPGTHAGVPVGAKGRITGMEVDLLLKAMMTAAAAAGVFDPDTVRGRGMWLTDSGNLIWHSGEAIYRVDKNKVYGALPSEIERKVYPQEVALLSPWRDPVPYDKSPATGILKMIKTWNWERPVLDPIFVIGWIGCALLGAALPWRPTLFVVGDSAAGKSTLQQLLRNVLGNCLLATANASAAGIYQKINRSSLPVSVDELEAKEGDKRGPAVVELARLAASGDDMYRGGSDHQGVSFTMRNAFIFSAINPPAMEPADRQRMIMLNLRGLERMGGTFLTEVEAGEKVLRILMDQWPHFNKLWVYYRDSLAEGGFQDRGTYSVTLAVAHMLLGAEALEEAGLPVAEPQSLGNMIAAATSVERSEYRPNWHDCLLHALSSMIDQWKDGTRWSVGTLLERWQGSLFAFEETRERLATVGLGLVHDMDNVIDKRMLAIPIGRSAPVLKLFEKTKWANGVWVNALKQAPASVVVRDRTISRVRIGGVQQRCMLIDLKAFDDLTGGTSSADN